MSMLDYDRAHLERKTKFKTAWDAYHNQLPPPLKIDKKKPNDNVQVNLAKLIVNKGVSFLFGKEIKFELDLINAEPTNQEKWLDRVWQENKKTNFLKKLAINGAVCGHAFVFIMPPEDQSEPEEGQKPSGASYPRLVVLDPATVNVETDPNDIDEVETYTIVYDSVDKDGNPGMYKKEVTEEEEVWWVREYFKKSESLTQAQQQVAMQSNDRDDRSWEMTSESQWPYSWPPIIECQNLILPNEFWGLADIEKDVIDLIRALNFQLSNMQKILRYHAHPRFWAKGIAPGMLKTAPDEMLTIQNENATFGILESSANGLTAGLTYYTRLKEVLHETARIPEVATGKLEGVGAFSGVALSILYQPLIELTEDKRGTYGDMLIELNRRLLEMGGFGSDQIVKIIWPELLPRDASAERMVAGQDLQMGIVSKQTISAQLGYDYELEKDRIAAEKQEALKASIDAQGQVSQAMQAQAQQAQGGPGGGGATGGPGANPAEAGSNKPMRPRPGDLATPTGSMDDGGDNGGGVAQ